MKFFPKLLPLVFGLIFVGVLIFQKDTSQLINLEGEQITLDIGQYGDVSSTNSNTVTLQFSNQSSSDLAVTGWKTSCGCMSVSPKVVEVVAGDSFDVDVTIDMKAGGKQTIWLQPILQQGDRPSIVHLAYTFTGAGRIHVLDSVVMIDEYHRGTLRMICVSPFKPSSELLINTSVGVEVDFSGWTEIKSLDGSGRLWQSTVEVNGQASSTSWIQIQTEDQSLGVFTLINES